MKVRVCEQLIRPITSVALYFYMTFSHWLSFVKIKIALYPLKSCSLFQFPFLFLWQDTFYTRSSFCNWEEQTQNFVNFQRCTNVNLLQQPTSSPSRDGVPGWISSLGRLAHLLPPSPPGRVPVLLREAQQRKGPSPQPQLCLAKIQWEQRGQELVRLCVLVARCPSWTQKS